LTEDPVEQNERVERAYRIAQRISGQRNNIELIEDIYAVLTARGKRNGQLPEVHSRPNTPK